jgi:acyl transferase domain-containing protein/acyl carrier protein
MLANLRRLAQGMRFAPPRIPLVSNVTGQLWPWDEAPDADYWCRHARQTVRFAASVATLREMGYRTFLEVGPAPTLLGLISDAGPDSGRQLLPSLRHKHGDWQVLLSTVSQLYAHGTAIDWAGFDRDYARAKVPVPTYAFEPTRCWLEPTHRPDMASTVEDAAAVPEEGEECEVDDADLLYRLEWQPAPEAEEARPADAVATWLVLADDTGAGDELVAALAERGDRYVRVAPGERYGYDGGTEAVVGLDGPGDVGRLLDAVPLAPGGSLEVVHLWSLSDRDEAADSGEDQLRAQLRACGSAVPVVQALAKAGPTKPARLWLVTRGAVAPTGPTAESPLALSQSTLWGLGRSLQQEHPAIWGGLVDLDPGAPLDSLAPALLREIDNRGREDQIALRGERRYVARLARAPLPEHPVRAAVWRTDASYLITGGLTGIGLEVARAMVRAGARHLVLVGRTAIPPRGEWSDLAADDPVGRRVAAVRELESLGASVLVESLDVSDEAKLGAFLHRFDREGRPPIRGVVHSAGIAEITPLLEATAAAVARQLRPKSVGAWVLHRMFVDRPLDHFVLFGSASSILSSPFTAPYAAANAFLDTLAQARRAEGKPALCIGWGLWLGTGMAELKADPAATEGSDTGSVRAQLRLSSGMGSLRPRQGTRVFHELLRHGEAQVAAVPIDWPVWGRRYQEASRSALLAGLLDGPGGAATRRRTAGPSAIPSRAALLAMPTEARAAALAEALHLGVAATLGAPPATVQPDQPLVDLGFDSLMAVELRNEMEGQLGVFLPVSAFLAEASVTSLAGAVLDLLAKEEAAGETEAPTTIQRVRRVEDIATALLAQIDELPEEQAHLAFHGGDQR